MNPILLALLNKYGAIVKYVVFGIVVVLLLFLWRSKSGALTKLQQEMELYKRQQSGQLSQKERDLQAANDALGVAQSNFLTQKNLAEAYKAENIKANADFEKYKQQYRIELAAYQRTIAQLQEQLSSRDSTVVTVNNPREATDPKPDAQFDHAIDPTKEKLTYSWSSGDGRFSLYDPDVFVSNVPKTFKLNQEFRVTGEIYKQRDGYLMTNRLMLEEVLPNGKESDGSTKYMVVGTAKLIESHFNYSEQAPDTFAKRNWFALEGVISANTGLNNGLNARFLLGAGVEALHLGPIGAGAQLYLDTNTPEESGFGVDVAYRPIVGTTQLNLSFDVGLATQFKSAFGSWIGTMGLKFYLW